MSKRGNGEVTIYYSEKLNKWIGQFTLGRKANGKINRKSVYGKTRKEVKEKMTKALAEIQSNTYIKNNITLIELAREIVEDKKDSNEISSNTYKRATYTLKYIENGDIANIPIQKIKAKHIKYYLKTITIYANSTIEKIYQLLGQTFRRAIKLDDIDKNYLYVSQTMTRDENDKTILGTKTKTSKSKSPITINITIK